MTYWVIAARNNRLYIAVNEPTSTHTADSAKICKITFCKYKDKKKNSIHVGICVSGEPFFHVDQEKFSILAVINSFLHEARTEKITLETTEKIINHFFAYIRRKFDLPTSQFIAANYLLGVAMSFNNQLTVAGSSNYGIANHQSCYLEMGMLQGKQAHVKTLCSDKEKEYHHVHTPEDIFELVVRGNNPPEVLVKILLQDQRELLTSSEEKQNVVFFEEIIEDTLRKAVSENCAIFSIDGKGISLIRKKSDKDQKVSDDVWLTDENGMIAINLPLQPSEFRYFGVPPYEPSECCDVIPPVAPFHIAPNAAQFIAVNPNKKPTTEAEINKKACCVIL
jgi:hypothetical protein